ncbi:MAG TPA: hypothetical protein VFS39_17950 [Nitrospira sp.]|nr:hypothetical protein [Nitrospira sp.]
MSNAGLRSKLLRTLAVIALSSTSAACINYNVRLLPDDAAVKPALAGSDCGFTLFGLGGGDLTFENAMKAGYIEETDQEPVPKTGPTQISKLHSAELQDLVILFFGMRCLEVKGE